VILLANADVLVERSVVLDNTRSGELFSCVPGNTVGYGKIA
jgi:hypothetical protein